MKSILLFGFLIGLRHALEADHLAAVASLSVGRRSVGATVLRGAVWGLGHTITLLIVAGGCLLLGSAIPEGLARLFEAAVGVMLVALGTEVLWRLHRQRPRLRLATPTHPEVPDGATTEPFPHRALAVGLVHGLAGSAALVLLTLETAGSPWLGVAYVALFGVGSIVGMAMLSVAIALPLRNPSGLIGRAMTGLERTVGAATVVLGLWVLLRQSLGS